MESVAAIILAGGSSRRMNGIDKLWHPVAGRPLLAYTVDVFDQSSHIDLIILVTSHDRVDDTRALCTREGWKKIARIVPGGAKRQDTVRIGLTELVNVAPSCEWVMIHDGARPFVPPSMIAGGMDALRIAGAAVPVIPAADTVKEVREGSVEGTRDRSRLYLAQTPQCFSVPVIVRAYAHATGDEDATDDSTVVERLGERVVTFPGSSTNIKITVRDDLVLAEALAQRKSSL